LKQAEKTKAAMLLLVVYMYANEKTMVSISIQLVCTINHFKKAQSSNLQKP
jgi:hypothetical protein